MTIIKNLQTINAGKHIEIRQPSYTVGGNVNWYTHYGEQYGGSLKKKKKLKIELPYSSAIPRYIPKEKHRLKEYMHPNVHAALFTVILEKEMATHSSILAWKIPWMEEPGRL